MVRIVLILALLVPAAAVALDNSVPIPADMLSDQLAVQPTSDMAQTLPQIQPLAPQPPPQQLEPTLPLPPLTPEDAYYELRRLIFAAGNPVSFSDSLLRTQNGNIPSPAIYPSLSTKIIELAGLALSSASGIIRHESGRILVARLSLEPDIDACRTAADRVRALIGPEWDISRSLLDLYVRFGDEDQVLEALAELRSIDPKRAETEVDFLMWTEIFAKFRSGRPDWSVQARPYILQRTTTTWGLRILELAAMADAESGDLTAAESAIAGMRAAVYRKKNADGFGTIRELLPAILVPETNPAVLSDVGKACLAADPVADPPDRLIPMFARLEEEASRMAAAEKKAGRYSASLARTGWLSGFYKARLLAAAGRTDEATEIFMKLSGTAAGSGDVDSALWYWLDLAIKRSSALPAATVEQNQPMRTGAEVRREILASIQKAATLWKSPAWYDDIVDPFFREAVIARDWDLVLSMTDSLAGRLTASAHVRLRYTAARALESGLARARIRKPDLDPMEEAARQSAVLFQSVLNDPAATLYYRSLSAWRLGIDLDLVPPPRSEADEAPAPENELDTYIEGFLDRGLGALAGAESVARVKEFTDARIEEIARRLPATGNVIDSVRLARILADKKGRPTVRGDYELLYPRPWYDLVQSLLADSGIPESVFYGLIRSESLFSPTAVSSSGAVGLTQLMPPTAEETARRLKMPSYRITDPADNLYIGFKYYRSMVLMYSEKFMRGMFAYNAGPTRMKRWAAAYPDLPDDIILEILEYAETRQYGRNITQAALIYGALYYGWTSAYALDVIVDGKKPISSMP